MTSQVESNPENVTLDEHIELSRFFDEHADSRLLFTQAMSQTRMAMCVSDPNLPDAPIVFANPSFCRMTGYEMHEVIGRNCRFLQGPKTSPESIDEMRRIIHEQQVGVCEILNYRKDGSTFWNSVHIGPIYDTDGNMRFMFGSQWDVTDVVAARSADQQFNTVMGELNHRIMNMFSVISALISMTERATDSKADMATTLRDRIHALGAAHRVSIDAAASNRLQHVHQFIEEILRPYQSDKKLISISGPHAEIGPELVMPVGMVIHELATNSVKHGSIGAQRGDVVLAWSYVRADTGDKLEFTWSEGAKTKLVEPSNTVHTGAGQRIMESMMTSVEGDFAMQLEPNFIAQFSVPLTHGPAIAGSKG